MAWRIDEAVVRGEIDNRIKGRRDGKYLVRGQRRAGKAEAEG